MMIEVCFLLFSMSIRERRRILVHAATLLNIPNLDNLHGHLNGLEIFDERLLQRKRLAGVPCFPEACLFHPAHHISRPSGDSSLFKLSKVLLDTLALRYPALLDVSMGSGEKGEVTAQFAVLPESGKLMWFLQDWELAVLQPFVI